MDIFWQLALTFGVGLAAVAVVAFLFRIGGKKPNYLQMVAIPIGITIAQAFRFAWPISSFMFPFALATAVGAAVFAVDLYGARRRKA